MKNQYERQERWCKENLKRYSFAINRKLDKDLIGFVEQATKVISKGELFRFSLQLARMVTENLTVTTTYKADNGDEFVRIVRRDLPQPNIVWGEVKCKAVLHKEPIPHLSYYTEDGEFIATAGTHIHERLGSVTEFIFTKRASEQTKNDTVCENLGFAD